MVFNLSTFLKFNLTNVFLLYLVNLILLLFFLFFCQGTIKNTMPWIVRDSGHSHSFISKITTTQFAETVLEIHLLLILLHYRYYTSL